LSILPISHSNSYNFTKKHRHDYYEILFFEKGGGLQLIDLKEYTVKSHSCYIVHPKQVHLLKREPGSKGRLMQFREESIITTKLLTLLETRIWEGESAILFERNKGLFNNFTKLIDMFDSVSNPDNHSNYRNIHLLQVVLFDLLSNPEIVPTSTIIDKHFNQFLQLVNDNYKVQHSVKFYLNTLGLNEKKLGVMTKRHLGISPLKVIHQRLLLETKRLLLFMEQSHKEIAYELGFDSPSSFSSFIKTKTGQTPSALQATVEEIHK